MEKVKITFTGKVAFAKTGEFEGKRVKKLQFMETDDKQGISIKELKLLDETDITKIKPGVIIECEVSISSFQNKIYFKQVGELSFQK